jgi:hypothetical protein
MVDPSCGNQEREEKKGTERQHEYGAKRPKPEEGQSDPRSEEADPGVTTRRDRRVPTDRAPSEDPNREATG